MRHLLSLVIGILCLIPSAHGALAIIEVQRNGRLTFTNATPNETYRIESTLELGKPWEFVTNITAIGLQGSVQVTFDFEESARFFRVVWTIAPAAELTGVWDYQGFDPNGLLGATGTLSFGAQETPTLSAGFTRVNPSTRHPGGSGAASNLSVVNSNTVSMNFLSGFGVNNFRISGQMILGEFEGEWSYTSVVINPFDVKTLSLNGLSGFVRHSGHFSARRR